MDSHALAVLEFDKVRALLAEGAASALGLEAVAELAPITDLDRLRVWQEQTSEVRAILDEGHDLPLGGLHDLRGIVRHVGLGGVATAADLLGVAETLRCLERLKRFVGEREQAPRLGEVAADLVALPGLADELERCIGDDGEVADDASPELRKLRHQARNVAARVQTSLRRILGDLARSEAVQDAVVTIRQGRYCVPIKATHQGQFEGIIHDRSASGQTVFVEPAEVVRLNNELRDAQLAEREEVQRILRELSGQVALHADDLEANLARLTVLDLARARGRLSARLDGVEPELAEDGRFVFRQARHPLLVQQLGRQVVPIDLELGDGFTTLLITGPNTGGKTVSLKTVGLLTLMAQAGLHVPAEPGTRIALRRRVFADIGDEQSIEQSLSTFGAHLKQVVAILDEAGEQDLVLLDELGAGTDPSEGAALAEAVLTALHERGCRVIATTHHGSLKHFAYQMEGVENASVEFDRRSLAPTYRLLVGIPGASHALEIAGRYGMPSEVLERAAEILPKEHHDAASMIHQMQRSRQRLDREVRAAEHEAAIASHARRELEDERRRLRELEREIRDEAQREAAKLLAKVQAEAEGILTELRRAQRESRQTEQARQKLRGLRDEAGAARKSVTPRRGAPKGVSAEPLRVGDVVEVTRLGAEAKVVSLAADEVEVQAGAMRMTLAPGEVVLVRRATPTQPAAGRRQVAGAMKVDLELHLRGQTVDEAITNLERYLDHALLSNLPEVRIVHGKGTGTLKRVVQDYLKSHPYVKSYQHPPEHLGGSGVTVAKLEL